MSRRKSRTFSCRPLSSPGCADRCAMHVTGTAGGQEMLESLEKRNLFVMPLDDERRWYRYHQLFADLLQARLHQSGSEQAAMLRSRAAEWCEQDGQFDEAVRYALAAQNYPLAAGLIVKYWHISANTGDVETAWSWLEAMPEEVVRESAASFHCVLLGAVAQRTNECHRSAPGGCGEAL